MPTDTCGHSFYLRDCTFNAFAGAVAWSNSAITIEIFGNGPRAFAAGIFLPLKGNDWRDKFFNHISQPCTAQASVQNTVLEGKINVAHATRSFLKNETIRCAPTMFSSQSLGILRIRRTFPFETLNFNISSSMKAFGLDPAVFTAAFPRFFPL